MQWAPRWPFRSKEQALEYENVYLRGFYGGRGGRPIEIVSREDLCLEKWLEANQSRHVSRHHITDEYLEAICVWKVRSSDGVACTPPAEILSDEFEAALLECRNARSIADAVPAIGRIASGGFRGVRVRVASAYLYWIRTDRYALIDRRVTAALNLRFMDTDYNIENYVRWCSLISDLSVRHALSSRQIDRALFTYEKLLSLANPIVIDG